MLKTRTQKWWAAAAAAGVVILAASWFLMISPNRSKAADIRLQAESAQSDVQLQETKVAQLKAQFADLAKKKAQLTQIKSQMPATAQIPEVVTDVQGYAAQSGLTLKGITPGTPAVSASTGGSASSASTTKPVLVEIPLSLQTSGDFFESSLFLKSLQTTMTRSFLVSGIQLAADATSADSSGSGSTATPAIAMTLTGKIFVLLDGTQSLTDVKKAASKAAASS